VQSAKEAANSAAPAKIGLPDTKTILPDYVFLSQPPRRAPERVRSGVAFVHFFLDFPPKEPYKGDTTALVLRTARNLM
jgi:hypothetical protein